MSDGVSTPRVDVVLDVNVLLRSLEAGTPGQPPTSEELSRTVAGWLLNLAWKDKPWQGRPFRLVFSRHILEVFAHVADKQGICEKRVAAAWLVNIISRLPPQSWVVDTTAEDYAALKARALLPDGVRDADGRPDVEDEAVLRVCVAYHATLVTYESDELLPTVARRRGIEVINAHEVARQRRHVLVGV